MFILSVCVSILCISYASDRTGLLKFNSVVKAHGVVLYDGETPFFFSIRKKVAQRMHFFLIRLFISCTPAGRGDVSTEDEAVVRIFSLAVVVRHVDQIYRWDTHTTKLLLLRWVHTWSESAPRFCRVRVGPCNFQ